MKYTLYLCNEIALKIYLNFEVLKLKYLNGLTIIIISYYYNGIIIKMLYMVISLRNI